MKKIVLIILVFLLTGCFNQQKIIYLSDKYYNEGKYVEVVNTDVSKLNNETYILYVYNNFCSLPIHCSDVFKSVMDKYKIDVLSIPFAEFQKTDYYEKVKYAPSIIIVQNNEIIAYLDANVDDDLIKYQDKNEFEKWLSKYLYLVK